MKQTRPEYRGPWPRIRKQILERDGHTCQIRGPKCQTTATHVDHIIPTTKGGPWYDPDNLRAACKNCNLGRIDRTQTDRWQTAGSHITLVLGPPGSGKTTHVKKHARPKDIIIDYDRIAGALTNGGDQTVGDGRADDPHKATMIARNALLKAIRRGEIKTGGVWIISANPRGESMFPYHKVIIIDPGEDEMKARVQRDGRPAHWLKLIEDWYQARSGSMVQDNMEHSRKW